jgi:hypothetical protein
VRHFKQGIRQTEICNEYDNVDVTAQHIMESNVCSIDTYNFTVIAMPVCIAFENMIHAYNSIS